MVDLGLAGARVLVTGGASNIGRGIVHAFAAEGSRIVLADIDGDQAQRVVAEAGRLGAPEVIASIGDLVAEGQAERAVAAAVGAWGGLDVLVNNAGWSVPGFISEDTDRAKWQRTVEINLFTAIACTQAALPVMTEAGTGAIVFIASDAAFGQIRQGIYGATKAALIALARTTAKEHGRHGIRSNVVCPGLVLPESDDAVGASSLWSVGADAVFNDRQIEFLRKDTPLRRLTSAADVAGAVLWMSSGAAARQVTGQVISVSGGYSMP
jgi:2-hydroxycyclohexanecarboxyl-CoA dehydrogenase